ncbi:hypothetical protein AB0C15_18930 [Micromonospora sp. NPDC048835]|uniref:hypothetical protein n=1 Tax=Micromonospora sp. NPDC048835 TaxID=3155147 RepID=UPI0033C4A1E8
MRSARPVGLLLSAVAVVLWAYGMTRWQPLTEPLGPWSERLPGNNAYWARDLRFMAIMAVSLGLMLAGRGHLRWGGPAVVLGGCWIAADVTIDRADPMGSDATVLLAAAGCGVLGVVTAMLLWWERRTPPPREPGTPPTRERAAGRRVLTGAACVAAVLTLVASGIESPTDREPELNQGALVTAALLVILAVGAALAAAPARTGVRVGLAVGLTVVCLLGVGLVRAAAPGERLLPETALGAVLLTGVTLLAWDWPGGRPVWWHHAVAAVLALVGPVVFIVATAIPMMIILPIGAALTALAGNSPINAADSDLLVSLVGLLAGLGMAVLLARPSVEDRQQLR